MTLPTPLRVTIPATVQINGLPTTFELDPSWVRSQVFQHGFNMTYVSDGPCAGGVLHFPGKNPGDYLEISPYNFGWRFRVTMGDPTDQIVEFDVPQGFSVRSSTGSVNPWLAVRDRNDGCDLALRVTADKQWGEIRVGNTEGDYPGYAFHHAMGLKVVVDDGANYKDALVIEQDGRVRGCHASVNGRAGVNTEVDLGNGRVLVIENGLIVEVRG